MINSLGVVYILILVSANLTKCFVMKPVEAKPYQLFRAD